MKKLIRRAAILFISLLFVVFTAVPAFADAEVPSDNAESAVTAEISEAAAAGGVTRTKAIAAAAIISIAAAAGAISMSLAIRRSADGISRQPEAAGEIRTAMMLGLVFIETAIIYALIVAILVIFVL